MSGERGWDGQMNRIKHRLAAALLGMYGVMALGAVSTEVLRAAECSGLLGHGGEGAIQAASGEGGGDSWQAFLPGMLK